MWRRIITGGAGLTLIVLGLWDVHVQTAAIVVGLVLIGALSGDELARLIRSVRQRPGNGTPTDHD